MSSYLHDIDRTKVPDHVAIVMDGNGRWAKQRGLPRTEGHGAGEEALWDTVKGAVEVGVKWLTVYAFSTENWSRPPGEVLYLMNFNRGLLQRRRDELHRMNVRIRFIGRRDWRLPRSVLKEIDIAEALTRDNTGMTFTIAFNYGGRKEVVDAVKQLAREVQAGTLKLSKIDDAAIASRLYAPDAPDPDLLIRTSGEMRTSNFLLWEVAYSELWFTPVFWPDFNRELLFEAIRDFQKRERRFGGLAEDAWGSPIPANPPQGCHTTDHDGRHDHDEADDRVRDVQQRRDGGGRERGEEHVAHDLVPIPDPSLPPPRSKGARR